MTTMSACSSVEQKTRDERPGIELLVVTEAPLKPRRELARHEQLVKRLAVIAFALVHGGVADAAEIVKERALRRADHLAIEEPIDELLLRFLRLQVEADLRRRALREHLSELGFNGGSAASVTPSLQATREERSVRLTCPEDTPRTVPDSRRGNKTQSVRALDPWHCACCSGRCSARCSARRVQY
jgi:hypothetical protein